MLSGGVGTKEAHDVAVRLAIVPGSPIRDDLVIDTGLAHAAVLGATAAGVGMSALSRLGASSPYIYPPPLMGRLDDPFFGFVPPLVSFPPWWRRRVEGNAMQRPPGPVGPNVALGATPEQPMPQPQAGQGGVGGPAPGGQPFDVAPVKGQVELTVDASGQVFLRGVVVSEEAAREIEEAARSVPGVGRVNVQLQVLPRQAGNENPPPREGDMVEPRRAPAGDPPPPPEPFVVPEQPERAGAAPAPAVAGRAKPAPIGPVGLDKEGLTRRVVSAPGATGARGRSAGQGAIGRWHGYLDGQGAFGL